jgi:branched-chain amino acid transport system substrate-binding protein
MNSARCCLALGFLAAFIVLQPARAEPPKLKLAVHVSLSGSSEFGGRALLDAVRLAVEEANVAAHSQLFDLAVYDDRSDENEAREVAHRVGAGNALAVIGPASSALALVACPVYAESGVVVIGSTVHADELTNNSTTFRTVNSTGDIGDSLAHYLGRVLGGKKAVVLFKDNGYGRPFATRFKSASERLQIYTTYFSFTTAPQRTEAARSAASDPEQPSILLGMTYDDAVPVLEFLRRIGYRGTILGTDTMARASFEEFFADEPEERGKRGFFTEGVFATSPVILDSANAETLAFADRFRARFGKEPSWESVQAYDGSRLALAAMRAVSATPDDAALDLRKRREALRAYLISLDGPAKAMDGLTGPLWFTPDRVCQQAVRVGRFHGGSFESAPLQILSVPHPDAAEITSGEVFALEPGRYARLQRVVYTGLFFNEILRLDMTRSSFGADSYLWLRFARDAGPNSADPTDINFPTLISGHFDRAHPAEQVDLSDGTEYRLWRVQGEFHNEFELHRFPFDQQTLSIPFSNARAGADRVVYVLDTRSGVGDRTSTPTIAPATSFGDAMAAAPEPSLHRVTAQSVASSATFRNLTQWAPLGASERRENLVTESALGDLRLVGVESYRELSGFIATVNLQRRSMAALTKSLLPLLLMTAIIYSSLNFPKTLTKEKVTVAVTGALSGAVLLSAINNQLGSVGYTVAVEYVFYIFFCLSLLCIVSVVIAEGQRVSGQADAAYASERWARRLFLITVIATVIAGCLVFKR